MQHRNVFAAVLQLAGVAAVIAAGFVVSTAAGVAACGFAALFVGLALEGDS